MRKAVVIGGGTGTSVALSALKTIPDLDLTAIVTVADSGGSTGRLRDEFGFQPVGDLRQALAALSKENGQSWIRHLLLYRFTKGSGLEGHNLGNLILTALQDMTGSTPKAVEAASMIFRLHGHVYPVTTKNVQLVTTFSDGEEAIGEHLLDDSKNGGRKISSIRITPRASIYSKSAKAIEEADLVIIGPGDLYASLLPNLCVNGMKGALKKNKGTYIYIVNLMTHYSQTCGMTAAQHVQEIINYGGRRPDKVIINSGKISEDMLEDYAKGKEYPVIDDLKEKEVDVIRRDLLSLRRVMKEKGDVLRRSLLRHDPTKLRSIFEKLLR